MYDENRTIRAVQRKADRAAADFLVRQYYDEILGFMRKQTRHPEDALDLTQETFISMLRTIKTYDPKRGAGFRTWLYRVAAHKAADFFRARAVRITDSVPLTEAEPAAEVDLIARLADKELCGRILNVVDAMPVETQAVFRLRVFGDCTFPQIAATLHMKENSVKSKYHRLLTLLRKEFEPDGRER